MNHGLQRPLPTPPRRQSGISLVIVMVLLVATSILGIAVLRSSAMQERMSANLRDRSLAFQAAEAALRYAQDRLAAGAWDITLPTAATCTSDSICPTGTGAGGGNPAIVWRAVPDTEFDFDDAGLGAAPEYWIEYLGNGPGRLESCDNLPIPPDCRSPMYRVTARSRSTGRADVLLQANIISRIPDPGT